jgi:hypothetical protein
MNRRRFTPFRVALPRCRAIRTARQRKATVPFNSMPSSILLSGSMLSGSRLLQRLDLKTSVHARRPVANPKQSAPTVVNTDFLTLPKPSHRREGGIESMSRNRFASH